VLWNLEGIYKILVEVGDGVFTAICLLKKWSGVRGICDLWAFFGSCFTGVYGY
jgi:hypothetical protein